MKRLIVFLFFSALAFGQAVQVGGSGFSITSVTLACNPNIITVGQNAQCAAQSYVYGNPNIDVTTQGIWSSQSPNIATVSTGLPNYAKCGVVGATPPPIGTVTGCASGVATISFNIGNGAIAAIAQLTVAGSPVISQTGMTGCPSSCALPGGFNGKPYSFVFTASGGTPPYSWAFSAGNYTACGLTLAATGIVSGASATTAVCAATIQVTDSLAQSSTLAVSVTITVAVGGPPNYLAYQGTMLVPPPPTPNLGGLTNNGATVTDSSFTTYAGVPAGNLSPITRCTDGNSVPSRPHPVSYSAGSGGKAGIPLCNANNTLCLFEDSGSLHYITMLSAGKCVAPTGGTGVASGIVDTLQQNTVTRGSNSTPENFGPSTFDLVDPTLLWAVGASTDYNQLTTTFKYTFNTSNGDFTVATTPTVDYKFGIPVGTNAPEWAPNTNYPYGAYVTHTMNLRFANGRPEYVGYQPNIATTYVLGDLLVPGDGDGVTTNPNACAFSVTTAGTTLGTGAANFGSLSAACSGATVTDGTAKFKPINAKAQFVFQNVGATGMSCGVAPPAWYYNTTSGAIGHPVMMGFPPNFTDCNGIVWQNMGPNYVPTTNGTGSKLDGGVSRDHTQFAGALSTNSYGYVNPQTGAWTNFGPSQGTGIWMVMANASDPVSLKPTYYLLNTATGIQTNWTCGTGTLGTCASITSSTPGTAFKAIIANDGISLNCAFTMHSGELQLSGNIIKLSSQIRLVSPAACSNVPKFVAWQPMLLPYDSLKNLQMYYPAGLNHGANGYTRFLDYANGGYGFNSGVQVNVYTQGNVSGNFGALPLGCGATVPCLLGTSALAPAGPTLVYSIAGACQTLQNTPNLGANMPITAISESGTDVTVTLSSGTMTVPNGAYLTIGGISPAGFNGQWVVTSSTAGSFHYTNTASGLGTGTVTAPKSFASNGMPALVYGTLPAAYSGGMANFPSCNIANIYDSHLSLIYNPGQTDNTVSLGSIWNARDFSPFAFSGGQNVVSGLTTTPPTGCVVQIQGSPCPLQPNGTMYQFTHAFSSGTNNGFSTQFLVSEVLQDGSGILWSSDWNCTLGAIQPQPGSVANATGIPVQDGSGELGHLPVTSVPAAQQSYCGNPWQPTWPYQAGMLISPLLGTTGGGVNYDVFQAITVNGPTTNCSGQAGQCGTSNPTIKAGFFSASLPPTAAVAITAASEVGSNATITLTTPASIVVTPISGHVTVTGMTPAGYNCTNCLVNSVTTDANGKDLTINYVATSSGLGAGTVFGSVYGVGSQWCDSANNADRLPACTNGTIWQDIGPSNGRGDVFFATLK